VAPTRRASVTVTTKEKEEKVKIPASSGEEHAKYINFLLTFLFVEKHEHGTKQNLRTTQRKVMCSSLAVDLAKER